MIHAFLMVGQSNMAGRGIASEVEPIQNRHIKVLRNDGCPCMSLSIMTDHFLGYRWRKALRTHTPRKNKWMWA